MNPEVKELWTNALESGEYQQCKDALSKDDKFCCLGVLCDLYSRNTGNGEWQDYTDINNKRYYSAFVVSGADKRYISILPEVVSQWAGLDNGNPMISEPDEYELSLAELNDGGKPFKEIAQIIKKHL